jgi:outer membrane receptor protein involved in Fe transport
VNQSACPVGVANQNPNFNPVLLPYDLTRGGTLFNYFGHTDVKELALYIQDQIKGGNWLFNVGIRGDLYNGLAIARQAEPVSASSIASNQPTPFSAYRMRELSKLPSTRTSFSPAVDARMKC